MKRSVTVQMSKILLGSFKVWLGPPHMTDFDALQQDFSPS